MSAATDAAQLSRFARRAVPTRCMSRGLSRDLDPLLVRRVVVAAPSDPGIAAVMLPFVLFVLGLGPVAAQSSRTLAADTGVQPAPVVPDQARRLAQYLASNSSALSSGRYRYKCLVKIGAPICLSQWPRLDAVRVLAARTGSDLLAPVPLRLLGVGLPGVAATGFAKTDAAGLSSRGRGTAGCDFLSMPVYRAGLRIRS